MNNHTVQKTMVVMAYYAVIPVNFCVYRGSLGLGLPNQAPFRHYVVYLRNIKTLFIWGIWLSYIIGGTCQINMNVTQTIKLIFFQTQKCRKQNLKNSGSVTTTTGTWIVMSSSITYHDLIISVLGMLLTGAHLNVSAGCKLILPGYIAMTS